MKRLAKIVFVFYAAIALLLAAPPKPKLVVAVVIDQFRYEYLLRFRADYQGGLARLLEHGAVFTSAHYPQVPTVTAVGHATFLSGAVPAVSGIIGNEWYDRESAAAVTSVSDPKTQLVGGNPGALGSSPRRLLVSTVGDELKIREGPDSKVISISIKDRSSILPGGHMADGAYWFDPASNQWVTSNYYREALPEWARKLNDTHPAARYLNGSWFPFGAKDNQGTPLCTMVAGKTGVRLCGSLEATPWGNELIEEFAELALNGEQLGRHPGTDILAVSFSANDYVGHRVGPDDPAVRDMAIRADRLLGQLFDRIEQRVGAGNMLVVLTADHGVAPLPEVNEARHMPGGRLSGPALLKSITGVLTSRFGPGDWLVPGGSVNMLYFNLKLIEERKVDRAAMEKVAAEAAAAFPHIARVYTRSQLLSGNMQQDAISRAMAAGFYAPRSGDLFILQEPYYQFEATGASHGTPYEYDAHVPVIFLGAGIKAGSYREPILVNDIAPTLAEILGVARPSGAMGRVLAEILE